MNLFGLWCINYVKRWVRDARYTLEGIVEKDEGYFTIESSQIGQNKGKRSHRSAGKRYVSVMPDSTTLEDSKTGKKSNQIRYFKAKVLQTHQSTEINKMIRQSVIKEDIVFTDISTSYVDIADYIELHFTEKSSKESTQETLNWVHIFISNANGNLLGNYHKVKEKYLQLYLDEFVYTLNKRYFENRLFEKVVRPISQDYDTSRRYS
jgi:transposase-like protein